MTPSAPGAGRSQSAGAKKLATLEGAARGSANLMPPITDAAGVYATAGEISDCLRAVFGEYREVSGAGAEAVNSAVRWRPSTGVEMSARRDLPLLSCCCDVLAGNR